MEVRTATTGLKSNPEASKYQNKVKLHAIEVGWAEIPLIKDTRMRSQLVYALWPCAFYFCCSFAMNILTKTLITGYQWHAIYALGAIQNIFTTLSVGFYVVGQWLHDTHHSTKISDCRLPSTAVGSEVVSRRKRLMGVSNFLPLIAFHVGNMVLGFAAMRVVNMPMYLVLRRLTTLKVLLIEWLILHKASQELSHGIKVALLVSAIGSLIAGSTDTTSELTGYVLVMGQNLCSAASLTFSKETNLPSQQIILWNSITGAIICSWLAYTFELEAIMAFLSREDPRFLATTLLMCCMCVLYQFAIMICTLKNSALATSVTGNIKDLMSTLCGFLLFPDVEISPSNVVGVGLSLVGAYSFSYLKYLAISVIPSSEVIKKVQ